MGFYLGSHQTKDGVQRYLPLRPSLTFFYEKGSLLNERWDWICRNYELSTLNASLFAKIIPITFANFSQAVNSHFVSVLVKKYDFTASQE